MINILYYYSNYRISIVYFLGCSSTITIIMTIIIIIRVVIIINDNVYTGKIHGDFEKGFIMAEVMAFEDYKEGGSETAVKVV